MKKWASHILVEDRFSTHAKNLRRFYDQAFTDPRDSHSKRFVWDYWHVPDQYTLMRTPAYHYFPKTLYMNFHKELVLWGRQHLGCWDISPPWLSYYVDGCKQEFHSDVPHGPWAYVFSLSTSHAFSGGETLLLKPEILSYWNHFHRQDQHELSQIIDRVPSPFNRLTVFDPRYPHGVSEVRGTRDPREARVVIHGWFMEPKTYVEGPIPASRVEKILNENFSVLNELLAHFEDVQGTVSLRLTVGKTGQVREAKFMTNTLMTRSGEIPAEFNRALLKLYRLTEFPAAREMTRMTIPLVFS
jgi:hypothetical protein